MIQQDNEGFLVLDWLVSPREGLLSRGDESVHLEPKAMEVLVYLAQRPGEVITREQLERDVWHGAVVGYDAVTNTVIKLRKALQDSARQPRYIATIPKRGYQLIAPITHPDNDDPPVQKAPDTAVPEAAPSPTPTWLNLRTGLIAASVALIVALAMFAISSQTVETLSPAGTRSADGAQLPSIIVLPFEYQSNDIKQQNIANGMTEDIITDLSKFSNLLVFSSNTSNIFKGQQVSAETLGDELQVGFVLKGSIRRLEKELRVNAQLINTATGFNVWAERYDRKVSEIFSIQNELTRSIATALTIRLSDQEQKQIAQRPTDNLKAYDLFQEGRRLIKFFTKESNIQAREMYRQAIALDPAYGRAYGATAVALAYAYQRDWTEYPLETLDRALELARKGVALDSSAPQTYWALSFVHLWRKEYELAEKAAEQSIRVAPNYADGYGLLALINNYMGQAKQAITLVDKAISMNPYYSFEYLLNYGLAYYQLGDYETAISKLQLAKGRNELATMVKVLLAACYVRVDKLDEAEWIAGELQMLSPPINITTVENLYPIAKADFKEALVQDLRKAGLPE